MMEPGLLGSMRAPTETTTSLAMVDVLTTRTTLKPVEPNGRCIAGVITTCPRDPESLAYTVYVPRTTSDVLSTISRPSANATVTTSGRSDSHVTAATNALLVRCGRPDVMVVDVRGSVTVTELVERLTARISAVRASIGTNGRTA